MSLPSHFAKHHDFAQHSDDFMSWLKRRPGVSVSSKIQIADLRSQNAGRGVGKFPLKTSPGWNGHLSLLVLMDGQVASQDISEDEELFTIPLGLVLGVKSSNANDLLCLELDELGPWLSLMVVMIYEFLQGQDSRWAPYFQVLPTTFDTLMFWTECEVDELQGSAVVDKIGKGEADVEISRRIFPIVTERPHLFPPPGDLISFTSEEGQDYLLRLAHRMGSLIMAYAFDIEKDEDDEDQDTGEDGYVTDEDEEQLSKGMVPLADILNADADRNNVSVFMSPCGIDQDF